MKKFTLLLTMLVIFATIVGLTACGTHQAPVYEGMSIVQSNNVSSLSASNSDDNNNNITLLSAVSKYQDQNRISRLMSTKAKSTNSFTLLSTQNDDGEFEYENDEELEEDIKDIVHIDVKGDATIKYYVKPGEVFTVQVHIDNPNSYEIQSFTLNGCKYANYMFKEGSTMELLLLDITAPANPGYFELTIDAIKYIDGIEIKDVRLDGDKTIKAGIAFTEAPTATIQDLNSGTTSVDFSVLITDNQNVINGNDIKVYLSNGIQIVAEKELKIGANNVSFPDLLMGTTYEIGIGTSYDYIDGYGVKEHWLTTEKVSTAKAFMITDATIEQTAIDFVVEKFGYIGDLTKIELFDGATNASVNTLSDTSLRSFDGLMSNHPYKIILNFVYNNAGNEISDTSIITFTTLAKTAPTVEIKNMTSTQTSIGFEIATIDVDSILSIDKIELYKGDTLAKTAEAVTAREFVELLSDNEYTVKVSYSFDLNDGAGKQTKTVENSIKTLAKTAPTLIISNDSTTDTTIMGILNISDIDEICVLNSVKVYKDANEIADNNQNKVDFSGLDYYTDYRVVVNYSFNLNDGDGVQTKEYTKEYKTSPHLVFNNCKIINTSAVSEGDTIYMQVSLDNPSRALPSSVVVNGQTYQCTGSTTPNKIYVEIVNNGQFEGGTTLLTIETVYMTLDGSSYSIEPTINNTGSIFINGKLEVVSVAYVDVNNNRIDWCFPGDEVYALITLNNPTGYEIDNINSNVTTLSKINENTYRFTISMANGWNTFTLSSIKYHNSYMNNQLTYTNMFADCYQVSSSKPVLVSSKEDLLNMDDGCYYKLNKDIDLSGIEWHGGNLVGVFDGNGYKIQGMSVVSNFKNTDVYLGLFNKGTGVIENLTVRDITYLVSISSDDNKLYSSYYGGLIAYAYNKIIINNCQVGYNSDILINPIDVSENGNYHALVGGFVGYSNGDIAINGSKNYSNLTGYWASGFICHTPNKKSVLSISQCSNYGNITGTLVSAGIVGSCDFYTSTCYISNSNNNGTINGDMAAGIVNYANHNVYIINCCNSGEISSTYSIAENSTPGYSAICFMPNVNTNIINCLAIGINDNQFTFIDQKEDLVIQNSYILNLNCSLEQINMREFYTDILGWNDNVWDFDNLDIEHGKYPTLK